MDRRDAPRSFAIDRAPLLEVVPAVSTGHQTPDMRLARASATWTLAPTPTGPASAPTLLTTRLLRDSVRAENLPIGPGSAHVTVFHPHGLPEPEVEINKDADLVRGRRLRLVAEWAELGGALSTPSAAPFVGARAGPAPWRRIVAVEAARAFVPSLAVGAWIVADCSDATCTTISRERHVLIEAGKTSILE